MKSFGSRLSLARHQTVVFSVALGLFLGVMPSSWAAPPKTKPSVTIADVTRLEGDAGTTVFSFTVALSQALTTPVSISYQTTAGTASAGTDFTMKAGMAAMVPGTTKATIDVSVVGDHSIEPNEAFTVNISGGGKAVRVTDPVGLGTIQNDDTGPRISVADVTVKEGNAGAAGAAFNVSLSHASPTPVTVQYGSADGTAKNGDDYSAVASSLTFPAGDVSEIVSVPILGDTLDEDDEKFTLALKNNSPNSTISVANATATVVDDDAAPNVSVNDVVVTELPAVDNTAAFTVSLSHASGKTVTVDYTTLEGTTFPATSGVDYAPMDTTLTFAPGQTSRQLDVVVHSDGLSEPDETFALVLSGPVNAALGSPSTGTAVIVDDDPVPTVSVSEPSVVEGHEGTQDLRFTVTLSAAVGSPVSVQLATANETARSSVDFGQVTQALTFVPGERTHELVVPVHGDRLGEPNETFKLQADVAGVGIDVAQLVARGTIIDDDKFITKSTLSVRKSPRRVVMKGTVTPPVPGSRMVVKLFKSRRGRWVRVATKRPSLSVARDVKGDGVLRSTFTVKFRRPSGSKYLKALASYAGNARNGASKVTRRFRYR